jgi:hypothetical protein
MVSRVYSYLETMTRLPFHLYLQRQKQTENSLLLLVANFQEIVDEHRLIRAHGVVLPRGEGLVKFCFSVSAKHMCSI